MKKIVIVLDTKKIAEAFHGVNSNGLARVRAGEEALSQVKFQTLTRIGKEIVKWYDGKPSIFDQKAKKKR